MPFTYWEMAKGRIIAALVAWLVLALGRMGFAAVEGADLDVVTAFVSSTVEFLAFAGYGAFHIYKEKRKLDRGEVVPSRVERLAAYPHRAQGEDIPAVYRGI